jgi:hydroxyacylglutathione hydrolase
MPVKTYLFPCLQDNYGVLLHDPVSGATAAIDAPESAAVEAALKATGWKLTDILVTHHHSDHTAGIPDLKQRHGCRVVAPKKESARVPQFDTVAGEGDTVKVGNTSARVIDTPGHTAGHISYWFDADKIVFAADTLFSIGCGRILEGSAAMMWESLVKLRNLPDDTQVYCGHEYTAANIAFALTVDPNNQTLRARADEVAALRKAGKPTIPVTIAAEKAANPFFRADDPALAASLGMAGKSPAEVFGKIRAAKDNFRG